jgi:RNA polymerase sigma factor (sigma-70 family)
MPDANDMDLVREFARHNSEAAFTELVRRHLNLVYSVARRCTGNDGDAHDVTQAVFIILARKAAGLREKTLLSGWLYETTRFATARLLRTNARRHAREQEAYMQSTLNEADNSAVWEKLSPHLEDAMGKLNAADRALLVLRFYENKSGPEAAVLLGIREDAAHKRVTRALEKLRKVFAQRGVTLSGAAIAGAVSANSVQAAPVALAKSVTAVAIVKGSIATASTLTLVKGTMKIMTWIKVKTAIGVATGALLVAGTATITVSTLLRAQEPPPTASMSVSSPTPAANNLIVSPNPPDPVPQEQPARVAAPAMVQLLPKVTAATPRNLPAQPIYPTAPRISDILAAMQANGGGVTQIPPELFLQVQFGNMFQKLNLTTNQIAAFIKIMEDKQEQLAAFRRDHPFDPNSLTGLTRDQIIAAQMKYSQQLQGQMQPIDQAANLQIEQLLGSGDYNYYLAYSDQRKERAVVMNGYRSGLDANGVPPLTLDEDEQLVNLFYQARIAANGDPTAEARQLPQLLQQAGTFLKPEQVQVLTQYTSSLVSPMAAGSVGIIAN